MESELVVGFKQWLQLYKQHRQHVKKTFVLLRQPSVTDRHSVFMACENRSVYKTLMYNVQTVICLQHTNAGRKNKGGRRWKILNSM
jgi:hypothetical protein